MSSRLFWIILARWQTLMFLINIYKGMPQVEFDSLRNNEFNSTAQFTKAAHKKIGYSEDLMTKMKRDFLEDFNLDLTKCMTLGYESDEYKDYIDYFLGLCYYYGIMDNEITKMSDEDMNVFGANMFDCLSKMKNQYAVTFKELVKI